MSGPTEKESLLQPTQPTQTKQTSEGNAGYPTMNNEIKEINTDNINEKPMDQTQYKTGVAFGVLNCIAGVFIILGAIRYDVCAWFRGVFGVCITYLSLRDDGCDTYCLKWFPLWKEGNLCFIGLLFVFLGCSALDLLIKENWSNTPTWNQILIVLHIYVMVLGAIYIILFPIKTYLKVPIPNALPILDLCQSLVGQQNQNEQNSQSLNKQNSKKLQEQQINIVPQKQIENELDVKKIENIEKKNDIKIDIEQQLKKSDMQIKNEAKIIENKPQLIEPIIKEKQKIVEPKIIEPKIIEPQIIETKNIEPKNIEPKVIESKPQIIEIKPEIIKTD